MKIDELENIINEAFEKKQSISEKSELLIKLMDRGWLINGSKKLYF